MFLLLLFGVQFEVGAILRRNVIGTDLIRTCMHMVTEGRLLTGKDGKVWGANMSKYICWKTE